MKNVKVETSFFGRVNCEVVRDIPVVSQSLEEAKKEAMDHYEKTGREMVLTSVVKVDKEVGFDVSSGETYDVYRVVTFDPFNYTDCVLDEDKDEEDDSWFLSEEFVAVQVEV